MKEPLGHRRSLETLQSVENVGKKSDGICGGASPLNDAQRGAGTPWPPNRSLWSLNRNPTLVNTGFPRNIIRERKLSSLKHVHKY